MSEVVLSTMTLDGKLDNIRFLKETAINDLYIYGNIIKIGCNYGVIESSVYKDYVPEKKETTRGRKPKEKCNKHKRQGTGTHFNSQITFTILNKHNNSNDDLVVQLYQVKLFTNGRLQIPGLGKDPEYAEYIPGIVDEFIEYLNINKTLKYNENKPINITYNTPILQNYKYKILGYEFMRGWHEPSINLRITKDVFMQHKQNSDTPIKICSVSFHQERYAGLLVKFTTPRVVHKSYPLDKFVEMVRLYYHKKVPNNKMKNMIIQNPSNNMETILNVLIGCWINNNKVRKKLNPRQTTVKIFKSSKINIDNANSLEYAKQIGEIVTKIILTNIDQMIYYTKT